MDQQSAVATVGKYAEIVRNHFPVVKVILFGSYARGDQRVNSDIDVAVVLERLEGDFLDSAALAQRLIRDIDLSIEPILLVDEYDPSGFLAHIEATGITVYTAESAPAGK
jgi:predicted nucleotidyltransferase